MPPIRQVKANITNSLVHSSYGGPAEVLLTFPSALITISGKVFHDANGMSDNMINGIALNGTPPLYIVAIDQNPRNGYISTKVANDGTYTLKVSPNSSYLLRLAQEAGNGYYPPYWVTSLKPTGEHIGPGAGSDGTPDAQAEIAIVSNDVNRCQLWSRILAYIQLCYSRYSA